MFRLIKKNYIEIKYKLGLLLTDLRRFLKVDSFVPRSLATFLWLSPFCILRRASANNSFVNNNFLSDVLLYDDDILKQIQVTLLLKNTPVTDACGGGPKSAHDAPKSARALLWTHVMRTLGGPARYLQNRR